MQDHSQALKVYFEVTNYCNFRCAFCPIGVSKRAKQHMHFALFCRGIDEVAGAGLADTVGFHVLGEPLLYPRIFEAIAYARGKGLQTELHTNGSLLTEDRVAGLIESGLSSLAISVQLTGQERHALRGSSLSFDRYYQGVTQAVWRIKASRCAMDVTVCLMDTSTAKYFDVDGRTGLNGTRRTFKRMVSSVTLDLCSGVGQGTAGDETKRALRTLNLNRPTYLRLDEHTRIYAQPFADWGNAFTAKEIHPARVGFCGYALSNVGILSNGEVTICCADYDGQASLGNLGTQSLASILSAKQARAIRDGFRRMRIVHPYCQKCVGSPSRAKAWLKGLISIYLFQVLRFQPGGEVREVVLPSAQRPRETAKGRAPASVGSSLA